MNTLYTHTWGIGPFWLFGFFALGSIFFFALVVAVIALKGYALWHAAQRKETKWFIAMLLINTFGLLELYYLYAVVGKWKKEKPHNHTS